MDAMDRSRRVGWLGLCWSIVAGCSFDADGLASSSNSAGTLESSGTDPTDADATQGSMETGTTAMTGVTTMTTTEAETGPTTMPPTTTVDPSESSAGETMVEESSGPPEPTTGGESNGTSSSEGGPESTETGPVGEPHYGDCVIDGDDCGSGECVGYYNGGLIATVCYIPCDMGSCPPPAQGNAMAICNGIDTCVLDCAGDDTCPDVMQCYFVDFGGGANGYRCAWPD